MLKRFFSRHIAHKHGQSFVELSLVTLILALMLTGVVEFGYLLNTYLKVQDGAREAARFSSNSVAFDIANGNSYQTFYVNTAIEALRVMSPITLNGNRGDDMLISVFSVAGSSIRRWPDGYGNGWSLCSNYSDLVSLGDLSSATWSACSPRNTNFTSSQVLALMNTSAPATGVLLVEIYYNYPQLLKLPVFEQVIPDPIPIYVYAVMPISSAEPTATPLVGP